MHHLLLASALVVSSIPAASLLGAATPRRRLRAVQLASTWSAGASLVALAAWLATGASAMVSDPFGTGGLLAVRLDVPTFAMLLLVSLVGAVITRFSSSYLDQDPNQDRYARFLGLLLGAVSLLVCTDHLGVLAFCWMSSSLALHPLLTHFPHRPDAQLAAHEKFLVSRVAEVALFAAIFLVGWTTGTVSIDGLHRWIASADGLPMSLHAAAGLFVITAALKTAQLPFHGWLTRVMEAPTPVSALLHAGVVNIAGFTLLRLAPLMTESPPALAALVALGSLTAVIASLVSMTRVSIKQSLAWSTIGQMGFMLMQCGLGATSLALLHLLAHSTYKAHAFLSSGSTVDRAMAMRLAAPKQPISAAALSIALAFASALVVGVGWVAGVDPIHEPVWWVFGPLLAFALAPPMARPGTPVLLRGLGAVGILAVTFTGHHVFQRLLPTVASAPSWMLTIPLTTFTVGFVVQALILTRPHGPMARKLYPLLFTGLSLDRPLTRLTRQLWPFSPAPSELTR